MKNIFLFFCAIIFGVAGLVYSQCKNATIAGELTLDPPTLISLGFQWDIRGDYNRDAKVTVQYRKVGDMSWQDAMPLSRIGDEKVWMPKYGDEYLTPNMFAGSILDLKENTKYECLLTLTDLDGITGDKNHQVIVSTRGKPKEYKEARVLHVYPPDYDGPREDPSFKGLKSAYYGPCGGDHNIIRPSPIKPGDVILVHAGLYKADQYDYTTPYEIPFHGTYVFTIEGTKEKPIVIKSAGDGEVIFDGIGTNHPKKAILKKLNYTSYTTLDYNGYRPNPNGLPQFLWKAPAKNVQHDYTLKHKTGFTPFQTLKDFQDATGHELNGVIVDYDIFINVKSPDPELPHAIYPIGNTDFRLAPESIAVDRGIRIANLNDNFSGRKSAGYWSP